MLNTNTESINDWRKNMKYQIGKQPVFNETFAVDQHERTAYEARSFVLVQKLNTFAKPFKMVWDLRLEPADPRSRASRTIGTNVYGSISSRKISKASALLELREPAPLYQAKHKQNNMMRIFFNLQQRSVYEMILRCR